MMETVDITNPDVRVVETEMECNASEAEDLLRNVDDVFMKVDKLEQRLNEVEQFYSSSSRKQSNTSKGSSFLKERDKEKQIASFKRRQHDGSQRDAAKRMQDLIRQFDQKIYRQITVHKWAGPFMNPVDVVGLGLHDYYEVIEKPMDFSTIRNKMEAKDGNGYKHVREIYADMRLVFKNAMKYNDEKDDVHVMAKTLLEKFEEKWLHLLPKVDEEERKRKEEEAEALLDMQLAQEVAHAKMARDLSIELDEVDMHLEELREVVLHKCRKMSIEEKKALMAVITQLSPEDLDKALLIVAQNNPTFQATGNEVDLDMDAQSESTLWKLKFFVKDILQVQGKSSASTGGNNNQNSNNVQTNNNCSNIIINDQHNAITPVPNPITTTNNNKRKREICDALARTSQKRNRKPSS